ncbi:MAG: pilus assembly protein [Hyphomicrobiales bacterium]|nr:MAG: pilus assembly protein [Hyphomicrobiales bacterium]
MDMTRMRKSKDLRAWRRFAGDRKGVALVEFAMLLPVMLIAYVGMTEVVQLVMINRKVTQLTSALSDLTSRVQSVSPTDIDNIFNAAETIMMPYEGGKPAMVITSLVVDASGVAKVCWSSQRNGTALARGTTQVIPDIYRTPSTSVIMASASYNYTPTIGYVLTGGPYTLGENPIYTRPRNGLAGGTLSIEQVKRTDANACPTF